MYISNLYQNKLERFSFIDNDDFLKFEIKNLHNLFNNQMIAIKNENLDYIAISDDFAKEFNLDINILGNQSSLYKIDQEILDQEKTILTQIPYQDSIYFYKKDHKICYCVMRKRQLVNPCNNSPAGLLINAMKFTPGFWRKYFIQQITPFTADKSIIKSQPKLTTQQQQIAFGLLLGFHSRQEIAQLLNNTMEDDYNEVKIKNGINALYQKLECNSLSQLLTLISQNNIEWEMLPLNILGNFPFHHKY